MVWPADSISMQAAWMFPLAAIEETSLTITFALAACAAWVLGVRFSRPSDATGRHTIKLLGCLISFCILVTVAEDIVHHGPLNHADDSFETALHGCKTPLGMHVSETLSWLGALPVLALLLLGFGTLLAWRRKWLAAAWWMVSVLSAAALCTALKVMVPRQRPPGSLANVGDSFPSAHAMMALVAYGMFAYLNAATAPATRVARLLVIAACATVVVLIGASRLYLGDHYPSDVLGGYAAGLFCLFAAVFAHRVSASGRARRLVGKGTSL